MGTLLEASIAPTQQHARAPRAVLRAHPWRRPLIAAVAAFGAFSLPLAASDRAASGTLSFEDRVACQTALEEVYWRHRIWPQENPRQKPALAEVMTQAAIVRKVEDTLAMSSALDERYHSPIEPADLQAELDRMAKGTSNPSMLAELFASLGNDVTRAAECLARPALAERRLRSAYALDPRSSKPSFEAWWEESRTEEGGSLSLAPAAAKYELPLLAMAGGCTDNTWQPSPGLNSQAPSARYGHTAVWTGAEMLVWGGYDDSLSYFNTGARYNPATDTWSAISLTGAPSGRYRHTAVWTGTEMVVWGGWGAAGTLATGGRYNPSTNGWSATNLASAPRKRWGQAAVWTGKEMVIWGGADAGDFLDTGGRYDPSTGIWSPTSLIFAPEGRWVPTVVWTGSEMIVWGGYIGLALGTGGRYNPSTNSWSAMSLGAPSARYGHTAVWTGAEMVVWGGGDGNVFNTGGRYNPSTNDWSPTSLTSAPSPRLEHAAVWTGTQMVVWGGFNSSSHPGDGGRYDPVTNDWSATSQASMPNGRQQFTAIWTAREMVVWGGYAGTAKSDTGGRYCASGRNWVAMGDSYSSGEGAGESSYMPETDLPGENTCHRSTTAYSKVVWDWPRTADTFLACSGATTWNVLPKPIGKTRCLQKEDSNVCLPYSAPDNIPQLDHAEVITADFITVTMGGNDVRFSDVLGWCHEEPNCKTFVPQGYGMTLEDYLPRLIDSTQSQLQLTLAAIRDRARHADIRVLGYPALFPAEATRQACETLTDPASYPGQDNKWSPEEQTWLNSLVPLLNNAIRQAAENVGVRFVSVADFFSGHEICGPDGSWFVPPPKHFWEGKQPEIFHPTPDGHRAGYRRALEADLAKAPLGGRQARFGSSLNEEELVALERQAQKAATDLPTLDELRVRVVASACGEIAVAGQDLSISGEGFAAGATVTVILNAPGPQVLKTLVTDGTGQFGTTVALPIDVSPHVLARLEAAGTGANLQPRLLIAHITIGPDLTVDQDFDGISDACDNCPEISNPTQPDADSDRIGDACDSCLSDSLNDIDDDGLCSNADPCPSDPLNDGDGDGFCSDRDNCPLVANPGQSDADGDSWGDACDACPGEPGVRCSFDFFTVTPCRLADTRTTDSPPLASANKRLIQVTGHCGIPTTAKAVSVNLTVVGATGGGHVQAWPADLPISSTSVINFATGQTRANNAILALAKDGLGDVAVQAVVLGGGTVHLIIDVNGYFE